MGRFDRRVLEIKNTKKQGITNKEDAWTVEPFLGKSQYSIPTVQGQRRKTKSPVLTRAMLLRMAPRKSAHIPNSPCSSMMPQQYVLLLGVATMDPLIQRRITHITMDHATGVCPLNFVALTDSCDAEAVVSSKFWLMVETPLSTGTGPGLHNHNQNGDNNHKDKSGMLLRFSTNAGVTYYNNKDPRKTIPFDRNSPRRKLFFVSCNPATGTFNWYNVKASLCELNPFKTCFKSRSEERYCWT